MQIFFHQLSIAALLLLVLAPCCNAQADGQPAKLEAMRQIYEAEIIKRKLPILQKLADDLSALALRLTKANQLQEAVKARDECTRVEATLKALGAAVTTSAKKTTEEASEGPAEDRKEFSIPMSAASLQGRLKRPASGSYITNWVTTTCVATWSGGQIVPGLYDVYIDYDTRYRDGGGELKFEELSQDFNCVIAADQQRTTTKVGTFKLGTALGFTIRAKSKNQHGILNLYGVTFKPAAQQ